MLFQMQMEPSYALCPPFLRIPSLTGVITIVGSVFITHIIILLPRI